MSCANRTPVRSGRRAAQNDDQLNIDFVGKIDGEAFAGGSAKGTLLVLGSGRMIAGFEEGLVGRRPVKSVCST